MALWPVEMARCVARGGKDSRRERLSRIALEAAKQSGRAHVTQIEPARSFRQALEALKRDPPDLLLTAWEEEHAMPMSRAVAGFVAERGLPAGWPSLSGRRAASLRRNGRPCELWARSA